MKMLLTVLCSRVVAALAISRLRRHDSYGVYSDTYWWLYKNAGTLLLLSMPSVISWIFLFDFIVCLCFADCEKIDLDPQPACSGAAQGNVDKMKACCTGTAGCHA